MPLLKVNRKLEPFLTKNKPLKVAIGGRGSGKSIGFGDMLTMKMDTEGADVYCLREYQDSITDSVHRVFEGSITQRLKLKGWSIQENKVIAPNGARTTYKGAARNPDSIQSAQGYKYSWFEEAHRASERSLDKLIPTIIRNPGAECWFSANPQSSGDPFSERFINPYLEHLQKDGYYEDDLHIIIVVNWRDNPWWNEEQERLRVWSYTNEPRAKYNWIWEGHFNDSVDDAIIKPEWFDAAIDAHKIPKLENVFKPYGAVIAAHDPSDGGDDAKGIAVRHGSIIKHVSSKKDGEIDEGCDWAMDIAKKYKADWFIWDGDGMGSGLKRQVSTGFQGTSTKTYMFKGSLSGSAQENADKKYLPEFETEDKPKTYAETFKNNRSQFYSLLAQRFFSTWRCVERGEYVDPDQMISLDSDGIANMANLRSELCRIPSTPNGQGLIQIMSKQDMKTKLEIKSPNEGDSVMMTMFNPPVKKTFDRLKYKEIRVV